MIHEIRFRCSVTVSVISAQISGKRALFVLALSGSLQGPACSQRVWCPAY